MMRFVKKIRVLVMSLVVLSSLALSVSAASPYEPGEIYKRYSIPEGRYILCRINIQTGMDEKSLDNGETWLVVGGEFDDLKNAWCKDEVRICYESGIMKGKTDSKFAPNDPLTNSQVLQIATRLLGYWNGEQEFFEASSVPMYIQCKDYLISNGIDVAKNLYEKPNEVCSRYDFAKMIYKVTPSSYLSAVNQAQEISDTNDADIQSLYEAGILAGSETGPIAFEGERGISRGAAAAIIARLVDSECRIIF